MYNFSMYNFSMYNFSIMLYMKTFIAKRVGLIV